MYDNSSLEKERGPNLNLDLANSNLHTFSSCSARSHFDQQLTKIFSLKWGFHVLVKTLHTLEMFFILFFFIPLNFFLYRANCFDTFIKKFHTMYKLFHNFEFVFSYPLNLFSYPANVFHILSVNGKFHTHLIFIPSTRHLIPCAWCFIPSNQVFIPHATNFILISFSTLLLIT